MLQCCSLTVIEYHNAEPGANDVTSSVSLWLWRTGLFNGITRIGNDSIETTNAVGTQIKVEMFQDQYRACPKLGNTSTASCVTKTEITYHHLACYAANR
jgi:hypothetical protein